MKKKMSFAVWNSDVLSALRAFTGWSQAAKKGGKAGFVYAKDNFLSVKTLETIVTMKHQVLDGRVVLGMVRHWASKLHRKFTGLIEA